MISTRRIVAVACLAAGVTGLGAPTANAASADTRNADKPNPVALVDSLAASDVPVERQDRVPRVSEQLSGMNRVHELNKLHQVTDLVTPATGFLPAVEA
ncbi:hypothetical protein [Streptomyces sp. HUAS ZL42]|uniref:hypothetical protein n=1 Tax=Streptomyces sp. HUAS ZL42 TaxID=3231715 RepID=UPI00345EE1A5